MTLIYVLRLYRIELDPTCRQPLGYKFIVVRPNNDWSVDVLQH